MDEDILRTVEKISGKLSRDCYYDLCCLVKAAIPRMPGTFSMETLYPEAQRYSEKEKDTLAKAPLPGGGGHLGLRRPGGAAEALSTRAAGKAHAEGSGPGAGLVDLAPAQGGAAAESESPGCRVSRT